MNELRRQIVPPKTYFILRYKSNFEIQSLKFETLVKVYHLFSVKLDFMKIYYRLESLDWEKMSRNAQKYRADLGNILFKFEFGLIDVSSWDYQNYLKLNDFQKNVLNFFIKHRSGIDYNEISFSKDEYNDLFASTRH